MNADAQKFIEFVKTDEALQKKMAEAIKNYDGEQTEEAVFNSVVAPIAKEAGIPLTYESVQELSPEEMEAVNGGWSWDGAVAGGLFSGLLGAGLGGLFGGPVGLLIGAVVGTGAGAGIVGAVRD